VTEPIFWLVCSFLLVAVCLTVVLVVAIPAFRELARAARSAEKLFDTLHRDLPPTLNSIRQTGTEINHLTEDLNVGVERASSMVKQVDDTVRTAKHNVQEIQVTTRSVWAGMTAAWATFFTASKPDREQDSNAEDADSPPGIDESLFPFSHSPKNLDVEPLNETQSDCQDSKPQLEIGPKAYLDSPAALPLDRVNSQPEQD
jgi:uncharacterized protein YoxC